MRRVHRVVYHSPFSPPTVWDCVNMAIVGLDGLSVVRGRSFFSLGCHLVSPPVLASHLAWEHARTQKNRILAGSIRPPGAGQPWFRQAELEDRGVDGVVSQSSSGRSG